ncbi:MAG TPA: dihydroorotate dehydrogenase [Planctomycetota bacterium]|nr:dihydroorotate dehydrogenase [Planctomycetota bacterium]
MSAPSSTTAPGTITARTGFSVGPVAFRNPILGASGCFGYGIEYAQLIDLARIGGFVTKSLTVLPREGNATPRIAETPAGMLNSIGLENCGLDVFLQKKVPLLEALDCGVLVNVAGANFDDYIEVVAKTQGCAGIDGFEINVSCPNVKEGCMSIGTDPNQTRALLKLLRPLTKKPLVVKLSPNVTSVATIATAAADQGADGLSLINTILGMAVDVEKRAPKVAMVTAGLSGPAIRPVAVRMCREVCQAVKGLPVIGMGGITCVEDALEFFMVGCQAVQVGTFNYVDPTAIERLPEQLVAWMDAHGVKTLSEIIGCVK